MELKEAKQAFYVSSETLSELIRRLVFAGIAIIWLFRVGGTQAGGVSFEKDMLVPLALCIVCIICDIIQYLYKTVAWWIYYEFKHRAGVLDDTDVDPSGSLNVVTWIMFFLKVGLCLLSFSLLLYRIGVKVM
jgi:hypothetical protein